MRIQDLVKSVRLNRVLAVVIAGVLLVVTTACANPPAPTVSGTGSYTERRGQQTELYAPVQKPKGGMNQYEDTEPTVDNKATKTEAKALVDRAKSNLRKSIDDPKDYARNYRDGAPLDERVERLTDDVTSSIKETGEDVVEGTQRGLRNIRENTQDAGKEVGRNVDQAARKASNEIQDRT